MTKEKRTTILMAVLLLLLGLYFARPWIEARFILNPLPSAPGSAVAAPAGATPLEARLEVLRVTPNEDGSYTAHIHYVFRGGPHPRTMLLVQALKDANDKTPFGYATQLIEQGEGTVAVVLERPTNALQPVVTRRVQAVFGSLGQPMAKATFDHLIEWPEQTQYMNRVELFKKTPAQLYSEAVALIDGAANGDPGRAAIEQARVYLERLMLLEPRHAGAQIEMARIALHTNWGPVGHKQAERYLLGVLEQEPANANAKVLLGFVYAHQKRYKESEGELARAAEIGTPNRWLWTNWGQLMAMQGKDDAAIEKYAQAISGKRSFDTYDRARISAYRHLLTLLEKKKQYERMDALHRQRVAEFDKTPCFRVEYALFRLASFDDPDGAITQAKSAHDDGCRDSAPVLGAAYYLAWSRAEGEARSEAMNRARTFLPDGPTMMYEMARSDATAKVIPALVKNGSAIGMQDGNKMSALAYALSYDDLAIAQRLLRAGAKPLDPVGDQAMPAALIPLLQQSLPGVALMQRNGVNYARLRYQGMSGLELARRLGNPQLVKAVEQGSSPTM